MVLNRNKANRTASIEMRLSVFYGKLCCLPLHSLLWWTMLSQYTSVHLRLKAVCTQLIILITNCYTTVSGIYFPQRHCYMSTKCWIVNKNSTMLRPITKRFPKAAKSNVPQCWTMHKGLHYFTLRFFHFIAKVNKNVPPPPQVGAFTSDNHSPLNPLSCFPNQR